MAPPKLHSEIDARAWLALAGLREIDRAHLRLLPSAKCSLKQLSAAESSLIAWESDTPGPFLASVLSVLAASSAGPSRWLFVKAWGKYPSSRGKSSSPQPVQDQGAKSEEDNDTSPEDPFVLLGSALDHANGVSADAKGIGDTVQPPLSAFEDLPLLSKITQHGSASVEELV